MTDPTTTAARIGDALGAAAIWHEDRCSWIAPVVEEVAGERPRLSYRPLGRSLYDGTAGVGLFLAELAVATGELRYARVARGAARHAAADGALGEDDEPGLYTGTLGRAFALARISEALDDAGLAESAAALLRGPIAISDETDLISGLAGTVIGLVASERWMAGGMVERATPLCEVILDRAETVDGRSSWPTVRPEDRMGNLLGLSHGVSGIALSLAECGAASGRSDLLAGATAGFAHESLHFDAAHGNWPDLRSRTRTGARGPSFVVAWCHGAAGMALARARALPLLDDPGLYQQALRSLETTVQATRLALDADGAEFCLCHGLSGNADILLEGSRLVAGESAAAWGAAAMAVAEAGIERYGDSGHHWPCGPVSEMNPTLMLGVAGVGLFLLRLTNPSIASPLSIGGRHVEATPASQPPRSTPSQEVVRAS